MRNAIEIRGLSKRYSIGASHGAAHGSLRDAITAAATRALRRRRHTRQFIWSLRDVDLDVAEGDVVGIIGRNGAGKSTLLKIVTRIAEPTLGVSRTRGKVGSLLEVGTGFHDELTGRENVFLNGAILGMSRRTTAQRFDEIVAFANMERFIDTPVKRYSSGMYLRLAFAVAAHLDSDVLVVDEVLAVGDAEFQRRCLSKMEAMQADGRTVLFVSHDVGAVRRLCRTAVWLDAGRLLCQGPAPEVIAQYLKAVDDGRGPAALFPLGSEDVQVLDLHVLDEHGRPQSAFVVGDPFQVAFTVQNRTDRLDLDVSVLISAASGLAIADEAWSESMSGRPLAPGLNRITAVFPGALCRGEYSVGLWLGSAHEDIGEEVDLVRFTMEGDGEYRRRLVRLHPRWAVDRLGPRPHDAPRSDKAPPDPGELH